MFRQKRDEGTANGSALAPGPIVRTSAPAAARQIQHLQTYGEVPKFTKLLSAGDQAVISLSKTEQATVVVIEEQGKMALVVHADADQTHLEAIKGKLIESGFTLRVVTAAPAIIAAIYQGAGEQSGTNRTARSGNEYLQAAAEWIKYAVDNRATDIHLETRGSVGKVRFRVDGDMEPMRAVHKGEYAAVFVEKVMASLYNNEQLTKSGNGSTFDTGEFRYCMVPYSEIPNHNLKLRFQSFKGNEGPKTVLRLLPVNQDQRTQTFSELGYAPSHVALFQETMQTPSGMALFSGVTGSGKSTTIKAFVELNPNGPLSAVYTVEDPVEYPLTAHQIPVQRDLADPVASAKAFGEAITAVVRGDPDIVVIGEIRDRISSNAAQQFAETGAMALATVHAHLLSGIVPRLVNTEIGMNREFLTGPNSLTLLVYQALVPKLCHHCAMTTEEASTHDPVVAQIAAHMASLQVDYTPARWKRVGGCEHCSHRGTVGLTVVAEALMPDEDWLKPVREGRDTDAVEAYRSMSDGNLTSEDMTGKTVFEHTLFKALSGLVDARQCSRFDTWPRFVKRFKSRTIAARGTST